MGREGLGAEAHNGVGEGVSELGEGLVMTEGRLRSPWTKEEEGVEDDMSGLFRLRETTKRTRPAQRSSGAC